MDTVTLTDGEAQSDGRLSCTGVCAEPGQPAGLGMSRAPACALGLMVHAFKVVPCGFQMSRESS